MSIGGTLTHGFVVWMTGLPGSGKTTLARALQYRLSQEGKVVAVLDGDEIRKGLSADLGFSKEDREEHNRRVIFVSKLLIQHGVNVIVPLISPYREIRAFARQELGNFIEVWIKCSLDECIRRDPKGLYARALAGEITGMTGLDDPYEAPLNCEVVVNTEVETIEDSTMNILARMNILGYWNGTGGVLLDFSKIAGD